MKDYQVNGRVYVFGSQEEAQEFFRDLYGRDWITAGLEPDLEYNVVSALNATYSVISRIPGAFVVVVEKNS